MHSKEGFAHPAKNVATLGIEPGMKVADFGAGSGAYVFAIAEMLHGSGTVFAVDIQKDLLRRIKNEAARRNMPHVEIVWGDLEEKGGSKFDDATLDLVLLSNILFQVRHRTMLIEEAMRVVRDTGKIAFIDWSESYGGLGPHPDHVFSKEEALLCAHTCGLSLIREFSAGAHHYGLLFQKTSGKRRKK